MSNKPAINYDEKEDVCYINFHDPPLKADDTHQSEDYIFRFKDGKPIGVTILNFSKYEKLIKFLFSVLVD